MTKTLLEKAKKVPGNRIANIDLITEEHMELALAWANGDVSIRQVCGVLNYKSHMSAYVTLALSLKKILRK